MKSINIKNFGILKSAEVKLDGLTVITGVNDSGKSTVGKLLFALVKALNKLNEHTENRKKKNILKEINSLYSLLVDKQDIKKIIHRFYPPDFIKELNKYIESPDFIDIEKNDFDLKFSEREKLLKELNLRTPLTSSFLNRIKELVLEDNQDDEEIIKTFLLSYLQSEFYLQISPKNTDLQTLVEYKEGRNGKEEVLVAFSAKKDNIDSLQYFEPIFFNDATLIESPLLLQIFNLVKNADIIGETESTRPQTHFHIRDLIDKVKNAQNFNENIANEISLNVLSQINTIFKGEFFYNAQKENFYFTKEEAISVEAINTASGIKSFGIFQLLLKANYLNYNNLIIIDEPENHLHPKWQIEYAKMIVELVKNEISVIISSHSPYMIQALKYHSEKNNIQNKTNFYYAEIEENETLSTIKDVTNDLNVIFSKLAEPLKELVWK